MITLLLGVALAAGQHAGIPVVGVEGLGAPSFQTPEIGWTAALDGGWIRVFVGPTEEDAADWYARALGTIQVPPPELADLGDVAHGDGETLILFRDGNVAVMVRAEQEAGVVARRLQAAIVDEAAPAATPELQKDGAFWSLVAPDAAHVSFTGGRLVSFHQWRFRVPPRELVIWDATGRPTVIRP